MAVQLVGFMETKRKQYKKPKPGNLHHHTPLIGENFVREMIALHIFFSQFEEKEQKEMASYLFF